MAEHDEDLARDIGYALSRSPFKITGQGIETLLLIALALAVGLAVLMVVWRVVARATDDRPNQPPPGSLK